MDDWKLYTSPVVRLQKPNKTCVQFLGFCDSHSGATDRLIRLKLSTLKYRRPREDMIEFLKITHSLYDSDVSPDPFQ